MLTPIFPSELTQTDWTNLQYWIFIQQEYLSGCWNSQMQIPHKICTRHAEHVGTHFAYIQGPLPDQEFTDLLFW